MSWHFSRVGDIPPHYREPLPDLCRLSRHGATGGRARSGGTTRAWARRIYQTGKWIGVRWWSYYEPQWASIGLWDIRRLVLEEVRVLRLDDTALIEASRTIVRRIVEVPHR